MRPVKKGQAPSSNTSARGAAKKADPDFEVADVRGSGKEDMYGMWRGPLIALFGKYCSYCEIPMGTGLQVEHKDPKSQTANIYSSTSWTNLLLSCPACNYTKKAHPSATERLTDFVWPDGLPGNNNTIVNQAQFSPDPNLSSFVYTMNTNITGTLVKWDADGNRSTVNLPPQDAVLVTAGNNQTAAANKTIKMLRLNAGYDATDGLTFYPPVSDRRIKHRTLAWKYALAAAKRLDLVNTACPEDSDYEIGIRQAMERQIISTAVSAGFWSVWMTVFYQEYMAFPSRLFLVENDSIHDLLGRLFLTGNSDIDLRFTGTETAMIGLHALGDIPGL